MRLFLRSPLVSPRTPVALNPTMAFSGEHKHLPAFLYCIKPRFCSIGPKGLTRGTLSPNRTAVIPTVTDNLFNQNVIGNNSVSIYLQPTTTGTQLNGEMTFGGIDATKITEYPTAL